MSVPRGPEECDKGIRTQHLECWGAIEGFQAGKRQKAALEGHSGRGSQDESKLKGVKQSAWDLEGPGSTLSREL